MIGIAKHPRNGKQIRILKSEGCVWRDAKTLVWLQGDESPSKGVEAPSKGVEAPSKGEETAPSKAWNRYDVGVSTIEAFNSVVAAGIEVDICVLLGDERKAKEWILTKQYKKVRVFAVTKSLLKDIGFDVMEKLSPPNMLCLEDTLQLYPILETPWDSTEADARIMMSLLLQYKRSFPIVEGERSAVAIRHGLSLGPTIVAPRPLYFITQFYVPLKPKRAKEIVECLKRNAECPYIDRIILLNEKMEELPVKSDKIQQHVIGDRLNFKYVFQHILEHIPRDSLLVIANSDIYLDDSWRTLWSVSMKDTFLSLLRWDEQEDRSAQPKLFGPRDDSQDTWVVESNSVKDRTWNWSDMDIRFGQNGCDNVVNIEMLKQKFSVANPCMTLVTHHLHTSGYRTYEQTDIIYRPAIMYLTPTGIHDLKPETALPGTPFEVIKEGAFRPPLEGSTFQTMIAKKHKEFVKSGVYIAEREIPLFTYENIKQTKDGLLHTYNSIFIGKSETVSDLWSETEMSVLTPCVEIDVALVAFCPDSVANDPWRYMAHYLGKILYLRSKFGDGEFLGTDLPSTNDALKIFSWNRAEVPVLSREAGFQALCKTAHVWYPLEGLKDMPTSVEIATLRKNMLIPWKNTPTNRIVFLMDPAWITQNMIVAIQKELGGDFACEAIVSNTPVSELIEEIHGALGVVSFTGASALYGTWLLSCKSFVFEIQVESDPSIDIQQLCHVSKVTHFLHSVPRPVPGSTQDRVAVAKTIIEYIKEFVKPVEPVSKVLVPSTEITMPSSNTTGFFAHAGDSFREMVDIWAERGYVTVKKVEGVQQVWLGGVGEVLLYDRPTMEWLHASKELTWKRGLFGNPNPKLAPNATPWSFWPRRPRLVEDMVKEERRGYESRSESVVFYGRSENAVQLRNRGGADWATACSDYVHLKSAQDKYPYTQEEYLRKLQNACYGLCLAGYGKKCHREIECMAMGCVPIVAAEVDMDSYAVPPVEGVHYLRVKTPAEVKEKIGAVSAETWEKMSVACFDWWRQNCSAEGMWALTRALAYEA